MYQAWSFFIPLSSSKRIEAFLGSIIILVPLVDTMPSCVALLVPARLIGKHALHLDWNVHLDALSHGSRRGKGSGRIAHGGRRTGVVAKGLGRHKVVDHGGDSGDLRRDGSAELALKVGQEDLGENTQRHDVLVDLLMF
jgi:hypothetical protein